MKAAKLGINFSALVLLLASSVLCNQNYKKDSDYYDYYNYEGDDHEKPTFRSRPQSFNVEVGQSVIFPCDVKNQGRHVLIIKREIPSKKRDQLIGVGGVKVIHTPRFIIEDTRLTIIKVFPRDAGDYICTFNTAPDVLLRHTLNVQFPPSISASVPTHHRVAKGSNIELQCEAEGNPRPSIRWSRQEGPLPSGVRSIEGSTLKLLKVGRDEEGSYVCTADNGIGEPSSAVITVVVEYPPVIETQKAIVRTGEGDQVELVCMVRGRPSPQVSWTRDGQPVEHSAHVYDANGAHKHTLLIDPVRKKDFGAYVCIAENSQGQESAVIRMTGIPRKPYIKSSATGGESRAYTLEFETESYYPITELRILFRRAQLPFAGLQANLSDALPGTWDDLKRQVTTNSDVRQNKDGPVTLRYVIGGLDVATDYEAVVRVKNKYGWSPDSDLFSFSTRKVMAAVQHSFSNIFFSSGVSTNFKSVHCSLLVICCVLALKFYQ